MTLGCKVNQYETQKILESFEAAGFAIVPFDQRADVYVINSCSVTEIAESKSRYTIRRASRLNPEAKVVVTGCAAQLAINQLETLEGAHVTVPNPEKLQALDYLLASYPELRGKLEARSPAKVPAGRTRATLKVQDGCDVMCSYCSIPFTRPGLRSRPWREVLAEAQGLAEMGYREAVLTGVLIGSYGPATGSDGPDFEGLVEVLARESGLARLRISSIEMRQVTERLIGLLADGLVVPQLHIPLQSGDTGVLQAMNRPYTQADFLGLIEKLYARVPGLCLSTDVMVGFPTEDRQAFEGSVEVCRRAEFLRTHVFRFSPRPGTPADALGDPVTHAEKQQRALELGEVARETQERAIRRFLGSVQRVLVETPRRDDGLLQGTTDNYVEVVFAGSRSLARDFAWVRLDECRDGKAYGERVVGPSISVRG